MLLAAAQPTSAPYLTQRIVGWAQPAGSVLHVDHTLPVPKVPDPLHPLATPSRMSVPSTAERIMRRQCAPGAQPASSPAPLPCLSRCSPPLRQHETVITVPTHVSCSSPQPHTSQPAAMPLHLFALPSTTLSPRSSQCPPRRFIVIAYVTSARTSSTMFRILTARCVRQSRSTQAA
eukprot:3485174-Rhodomonas_salina.1